MAAYALFLALSRFRCFLGDCPFAPVMAERLHFDLCKRQQNRAFCIGTVFAAVCTLPMLDHAVLGTGCVLFKVVNPVVTGCRYDCSILTQRDFTLLIRETGSAVCAFPVFRIAGFGTGCFLCILMNEVMSERCKHEFCICQRRCAVFICIALAAEFALPVCSSTGSGAGCRNRSTLDKRMLLSRHFKCFLADMSAVAGIMIGTALIAGTGFMVLCRCCLVHIMMLRYNTAEFGAFRREIIFCDRLKALAGSGDADIKIMHRVRKIERFLSAFRQNGAKCISVFFDRPGFRMEVKGTVAVIDVSADGIKCEPDFLKRKGSGAVQIDVALFAVKTCCHQRISVFRDLQAAVSFDCQILVRTDCRILHT